MLAKPRTSSVSEAVQFFSSLNNQSPSAKVAAADGQDHHLLKKDAPRSDGNTASPGTLPALTGLRGLAALHVVVYHVRASGILGTFETVDQEHLVMLFFVLSGFLMGYLYWNKPPTGLNLLRYALARIGRVWPMYLFLCFAFEVIPTFWCVPPDDPDVPQCYTPFEAFSFVSFYNVPVDATYNRVRHAGATMYWTVPVEVQFYVVFAATWWLAGTGGVLVRAALLLSALAAFGGAVLVLLYGSSEAIASSGLPLAPWIASLPLPTSLSDEVGFCWMLGASCFDSYLHVFAIGAAMGASWVSYLSHVWVMLPAAVIELVALVTLVLSSVPLRQVRRGLDETGPFAIFGEYEFPGTTAFIESDNGFIIPGTNSTPYSISFVDPCSWVVTVLLIASCAHGARSLFLLRTRFFQSVGQISYGMYLLNMHIFDMSVERLGTGYSTLALALVVVFGASYLGFHLFEAPAQAWVRSLHTRGDICLALAVGYVVLLGGIYTALTIRATYFIKT